MPQGSEYPQQELDFCGAMRDFDYDVAHTGSMPTREIAPLYTMGNSVPEPLKLRSRREPSRRMNDACRAYNAGRISFADAPGAICLADKMTDRRARSHPTYNSFSGADIVASFKE